MKNILFLIASMLLILGCNESKIDDFIEISPAKDLFYEYDGAGQTVTITSSGPWTISGMPEWCSASDEEGNSGEDVLIQVETNDSYEERHGEFTVSSGNASAVITVTQYGKESLYADFRFDDKGTSMTYDSSTGTLTITYSGSDLPKVSEGQATVLPSEYGSDIRVIEKITTDGNTMTVQTQQGDMCNLFKNTQFTLITSGADVRSTAGNRVITPSSVGYRDSEGNYHEIFNVATRSKDKEFLNGQVLWSFHKDFNDQTILTSPAGELLWETCSFDAGLNGEFRFDFGEKKITQLRSVGDLLHFSYTLKGNIDIDMLLKYEYSVEYGDDEPYDELMKLKLPTIEFTFVVGGVPVALDVKTDIGKYAEFKAKGSIEASAGVKLGTNVSMGVEYNKGSGCELKLPDAKPYFELHTPTFNISASAEAKVSYYPRIDILIYKLLGPFVEMRPYLKEVIKAGAQISADGSSNIGWEAGTYCGMDYKAGLSLKFADLFKKDIFDTGIDSLINDNVIFQAPARISLESPENGLRIKAGQTVNAIFKTESYSPVTEKYYPCPFALVNLKSKYPTAGLPPASLSDINGRINITWTPAGNGTITRSETSEDRLDATVVNGNGDSIWESSLEVSIEKEEENKEMPTPGQWVDLGLSVKWAGWNVGATSPEQYGGYYAWGETEEKDEYTWDNYLFRDPETENYYYLGSDISGTQYDVANVQWGDGARMPTQAEIQELLDNCDYQTGYINDIMGVFLIGTNGNSIFIPAADKWDGDSPEVFCAAYIWSSTFCDIEYEGTTKNTTAYSCEFFYAYPGGPDYEEHRCHGLSVRPVKD